MTWRIDPEPDGQASARAARLEPLQKDQVADEISLDDGVIRAEVGALVRELGLSKRVAHQVVIGESTLVAALSMNEETVRIEGIIGRHGIDKSLAAQVTHGKLSLDSLLHGKRMKDHLRENRERSILIAAQEDGRPRMFALHGKKGIVGRVKSVSAYDVVILPLAPDNKPSGDPVVVHKLQFKLGARAAHAGKVECALTIEPAHDAVSDPVRKPQDRYRCSDKRLFSWLDAKSPVTITTLEGDVVGGVLAWIGRWELGLTLDSGVEVVVFRHALANVSGGQWGFSKGD